MSIDGQSFNIERIGQIAIVSITRPGSKNALRGEDWDRLGTILQTLNEDTAIRIVAIAGHPGIFSAGNDIKTLPSPEERPLIARVNALILSLYHFPKPTIAIVEGPCIGTAWSLALSCDMVIVDERAYFQMGWAARGYVLDAGISWFLAQRLGIHETLRLNFTEARYLAAEALSHGLATEMTAVGEARNRAIEIGTRLALAPALTVKLCKAAVRRAMSCSLETVLGDEEKDVRKNKADPEVRKLRASTAVADRRGR